MTTRRRGRSSRFRRPRSTGFAAILERLAVLDHAELREPVHGAPVGAQGTVIGFINDDTVAEIKITKPALDGLDQIIYAEPW